MENRLSFCQFYFQCLQDYWLYWSVESHCDYVFQWPVYQHFSKLVGAMWTKMLAKLKEYFLGWLRNCVISSAINWLIRSKLLLWGCNIWNFIQKYSFFFEKIGPVSPKYVKHVSIPVLALFDEMSLWLWAIYNNGFLWWDFFFLAPDNLSVLVLN